MTTGNTELPNPVYYKWTTGMAGSDHLSPWAALGYRAPGRELEHLCLYAAAQILLSTKLWEEERKRDRERGGRQRRHPPAHTDIIGNGENDNLEFKRRQSIVSSLIAEILSLLYPHTSKVLGT